MLGEKKTTMEFVMMKSFLALFLTECMGLELTLDREAADISGSRAFCGVVTCSEESNAVVNDSDLPLAIGNISSMVVYKIDRTESDGKIKNTQHRLVAELNLQQNHLIRVSDGIMVSGRLSTEQATLRLKITKEKDCDAEFLCRVRGQDAKEGREVVSSTRLVHQPRINDDKGDNPPVIEEDIGQILTLVKQFSTSLTNIGDKVDKLEKKVSVIENRIEAHVTDEIFSLKIEINRMESSIESSIQKKQVALESGGKEEILARLENTLAPLEDEISNVIHNLTQLSESLMTRIDDDLANPKHDIELGNELLIDNITGACPCISSLTDIMLPRDKDDDDKLKEDSHYFSSIGTTTLPPISGPGLVSSKCNSSRYSWRKGDFIRPERCDERFYYYLHINIFFSTISGETLVCPRVQSQYIGPYLCDLETRGGGWIIIQRRSSGTVDFNRGWSDYKKGFGSLDGDYWLGNEQIHKITKDGKYELRVELGSMGDFKTANYDSFSLSDESSGYSLNLGRYMGGNALDILRHCNGSKFSTPDRDNNRDSNRGNRYYGGWWYTRYPVTNLNGRWPVVHSDAMTWRTTTGYTPVSSSAMKIRKAD